MGSTGVSVEILCDHSEHLFILPSPLLFFSYSFITSTYIQVSELARRCARLRNVDLAATNVHSDGVLALRACVCLRRAILDWTAATREDADALRSARPRVYISMLGA